VTATVNTNIVIGDDSAEIIRGAEGTVSYLSGSGGNDTIIGATNGVAPGSTLEGGAGNDSLFSDGVGDIVLGGAGNDTIFNDSGRASLSGGAGNDVITGADDQTTVYGGAGNDSITFVDEKNIAFGEDGNDTIIGGKGNDIFAGGAGNDYIQGAVNSNDASFLFGNTGDDTLILGNKSADSAFGGQGADYVFSGSNATASGQWLFGDKGADTVTYLGSARGILLDGDRNALFQSAGTDAGADVFTVGENATEVTVAGGAGNDSLSGTLGANSFVYMGQGDDYFNVVSKGSSFFSSDLGNDSGTITLAGNDTLFADPAAAGSDATLGNDNLVITATGKNVIYLDNAGTGGGNDTLSITGSGNTVYGGGGNDRLTSGGGNTLIGGAGNDFYTFSAGDVIPFDSLGVNTYVAGSGASSTDRVTVQPGDSFTGGATFVVNGESELIKTVTSGGIIASDEKDLITIGTADGLTSLKGGDDTANVTDLPAIGSVFGGAGNDVITVSGTDAAGLVDGGAGNDLFDFSNSAANVTAPIVGGDGVDSLVVDGVFSGSVSGVEDFDIGTIGAGASITATSTDDAIIIPGLGTSEGVATITAGAGNDTISVGSSATGTTVSLVVDGGDGNDIVYGKASGGDSLLGGAGNDTLFGGGFGVTVSGSSTAPLGDTLIGGAGADVFIVGTVAKLGFTDDANPAGALGSIYFGVPNYITNGTSAGDVTDAVYNGIEHVDVIVDFNPAEGDIILFNNNSAGSSGITGVTAATGTSAAEVAGGPFEVGSIANIGNTLDAGGFFEAAASPGGTANTFGFIGKATGHDFALAVTGIGNGELDGALAFTYDTDTGGLYLNGQLALIFSPASTLPTDASIRSIGIGSSTNGISII
jgi:Ca2+-binding RTX toxin-like protein